MLEELSSKAPSYGRPIEDDSVDSTSAQVALGQKNDADLDKSVCITMNQRGREEVLAASGRASTV